MEKHKNEKKHEKVGKNALAVHYIYDTTEIWKKTEFENYEVSNFGRIRNVKKQTLLKPYVLHGYLIVGIKEKNIRIHRLVAQAFIPNTENKPYVNHKDCNKQNNHADNLEWCTHQENIDHAVDNNLMGNKYLKTDKTKLLIKQPNGVGIRIDTGVSLKEKKEVVSELLGIWNEEIKNNWDSSAVKNFVDSLSNYLVWHREEHERNKEIKDILSKSKTEQLNGYIKKSKYTLFSDLPKNDKALLFGEGEFIKTRCKRINVTDGNSKSHEKGKTLFDKGRRIMDNTLVKKTEWCLVNIENEFMFNNSKFIIDDSIEQYFVKNKSSEIYNYENSANMERILVILSEDGNIRFFDEKYTEVNRNLIYAVGGVK